MPLLVSRIGSVVSFQGPRWNSTSAFCHTVYSCNIISGGLLSGEGFLMLIFTVDVDKGVGEVFLMSYKKDTRNDDETDKIL